MAIRSGGDPTMALARARCVGATALGTLWAIVDFGVGGGAVVVAGGAVVVRAIRSVGTAVALVLAEVVATVGGRRRSLVVGGRARAGEHRAQLLGRADPEQPAQPRERGASLVQQPHHVEDHLLPEIQTSALLGGRQCTRAIDQLEEDPQIELGARGSARRPGHFDVRARARSIASARRDSSTGGSSSASITMVLSSAMISTTSARHAWSWGESRAPMRSTASRINSTSNTGSASGLSGVVIGPPRARAAGHRHPRTDVVENHVRADSRTKA